MTLPKVFGDPTVRTCSACRKRKPITEYEGARRLCNGCREYQSNYYKGRHSSRRDYNFRNKYGITLERYEELLAQQNNACAICKETCSTGRRLAVDHDHGTGVVRGLLCNECNQGLGKFKDSPELLQEAQNYLRHA